MIIYVVYATQCLKKNMENRLAIFHEFPICYYSTHASKRLTHQTFSY